MKQTELYFMMFAVMSISGWLLEVTCKYFETGRFINRGFLIGPYCPIYGIGSVLAVLLLEDLFNHPATVFFMAMIICGVLEYITSWLMEKLFHARWWDYSTRRFNLNGRICLETLIPFGLMCLAIVYIIKPALFGIFIVIPPVIRHMLCAIFAALFIADITISGHMLRCIRTSADLAHGDNTENLTKAVRAELAKKGMLLRRYTKAFPHMKLYNSDIYKRLSEKYGKQ